MFLNGFTLKYIEVKFNKATKHLACELSLKSIKTEAVFTKT